MFAHTSIKITPGQEVTVLADESTTVRCEGKAFHAKKWVCICKSDSYKVSIIHNSLGQIESNFKSQAECNQKIIRDY